MAAKGRSPVSSPPTYGSGYLGLRGSGIAVADRLQRDGLNRTESEVAAALFRLCSGRRRAAAANDANYRALKSQLRRNTGTSDNHRRKFEMYFDC